MASSQMYSSLEKSGLTISGIIIVIGLTYSFYVPGGLPLSLYLAALWAISLILWRGATRERFSRDVENRRNWEELLFFIYTHDDDWEYFSEGESGIVQDHPFVIDTNLDVSGARGGFSFLKRHGLIEERGEGFLQLTPEGFDVIREQEYNQKQHLTNQAIFAFTFILALVSVVDIIASELTPDTLLGSISLGFILVVLMVSMYFLAMSFLDTTRL